RQDGSVFEGQFRGRDRHGYGKFTWSGGGSYEGNFDANDMHGEGSYIWSDGSKYQGQWQRNNMGPFGIMIWTDGRRYEGQFRDGKKHGEGKLTWPDGRSYVGQWECGKQHGVGTTVTGRGVSRKSQWDHGKLVKWLDDRDGRRQPGRHEVVLWPRLQGLQQGRRRADARVIRPPRHDRAWHRRARYARLSSVSRRGRGAVVVGRRTGDYSCFARPTPRGEAVTA
ncbi:unnamed protein product, partial [Prorocentrum cordatum]